MDEMKKYVNRTGKEVAFVPFEQYSWFPFYDSMNKQQKAWYFYWRTEARKQHYLTTDLSYVFVHLYEILFVAAIPEPLSSSTTDAFI